LGCHAGPMVPNGPGPAAVPARSSRARRVRDAAGAARSVARASTRR
jgi:hypothetical protein